MSVPASDPVRLKIIEAIIYCLSNRIIQGGQTLRYSPSGAHLVQEEGYYKTIHKTYYPPIAQTEMREYPCCNLHIEEEECDNEFNVQIAMNQALLHNEFIAKIDIFLKENEDPEKAQGRILADVQRFFGVNYYIPDVDGEATVFYCCYAGSQAWGIEKSNPDTGITVQLRIKYRQQLTDPTVSG